jgi:hypothetical protein
MALTLHDVAVKSMQRLLALQRVALGLLFIVLGAGVPVHAHAEHEGDSAHVGPLDHGHGAAIVQQDMRAERPNVPVILPAEMGVSFRLHPRPRLMLPSTCETLGFDSRAPPTKRPRAPPAH